MMDLCHLFQREPADERKCRHKVRMAITLHNLARNWLYPKPILFTHKLDFLVAWWRVPTAPETLPTVTCLHVAARRC